MATPDADVELMLRVKDGDEKAFAELFNRHAPRLVAYGDRFFHNRAIAEEVAQEVFLRLWRARKKYRPRARFTTWLYTIATRVCLNELRRRRHRPRQRAGGEEVDPPDNHADPGQVAQARQVAERLQAAADALPERQRAALWLVRLNGFSYRQVADILGMSQPAVKAALFRATEAIRQALARQDRRLENEL